MSFNKAVDLLRLAMMATGRRGVCLADIEDEFNCVRRTAQRMIEALQEAFPATEHRIGDDGRHYWTVPARSVAALLNPTADELAASTAAIEELERVGLTAEATNLRNLDRKVRALLPPDSSYRLAVDEEALLEALGYAARPGPRPAANPDVDAAIAKALKGPFRLRISYLSRDDTEPYDRTIEPYGLLLGTRRYLVGKDIDKKDRRLRHYRVEDIVLAEPLATSFGIPAKFKLSDYAERAFGSYQNDSEYGPVAWKFAPSAAAHARRYLFHPRQETEELEDGSLVVRFSASGQLEMCWHLYAWGDKVEVLEPESLAAMIAEHRRGDFPALP